MENIPCDKIFLCTFNHMNNIIILLWKQNNGKKTPTTNLCQMKCDLGFQYYNDYHELWIMYEGFSWCQIVKWITCD